MYFVGVNICAAYILINLNLYIHYIDYLTLNRELFDKTCYRKCYKMTLNSKKLDGDIMMIKEHRC